MNIPIKPMLIGGVAGGLVGFLVGTIIVNNFMKEDEEWMEVNPPTEEKEIDDVEPEEVRPLRKRPLNQNGNDKSRSMISRRAIQITNGDRNRVRTRYDKPGLEDLVPGNPVNAPETDDEHPLEDFQATQMQLEDNMSKDPVHIRVISANEFSTGEPKYAKHELTYYKEEDLLTDDSDMPITKEKELIGSNWIDNFDSDISDDPDLVYVRNDQKRADYQIHRVMTSYMVDEEDNDPITGRATGGKKSRSRAEGRREGNDKKAKRKP